MIDRKYCNRIEIWSPRYKDAADKGSYVVLIAKFRVADHNIIWFSKARHLEGQEYYMSGNKIRTYPEESNGKITCYAVPLSDMQLLTSSADDQWDRILEEYDELERKVKESENE